MFLVVGASGFLGSYVVKKLYESTDEFIIESGRHFAAPTVYPSDRVKRVTGDIANISDMKRIAAECFGERVIVFYFAAMHNIDEVAENPQEAHNINVTSYARFLKEFSFAEKLFFASTDCVYGDRADYYFRESDIPVPVNEYGRQKLSAERLTEDAGFTVCRLPLMYGSGSICGKTHLYDRICMALAENKSIELIEGFYRSAMSYKDVADNFVALSMLKRTELPSVINICSSEKVSKYDIGIKLADEMNKPRELIKKLPESEGSRFYVDVRAKCTLMDNSLLLSLIAGKGGDS